MKRVFIALKMAGVAGREKLSGIFRFLGENHDWDVTLIRTAAEFTPARMQQALTEGYDGFIVSIPDTEKTAALLAATDVPTLVMDIHDPALACRQHNIAFIRNSPEEIGRAAANHLLAIGRCRAYAFVHSPSVLEWGRDRFKAFRCALRDRELWAHELNEPAEIRELPRPVGVFAANDDRGYDILEYCRRHRLKVGRDVFVLGTNNDTLICENCRPRLSSIQPDFEQEGFLAAQVLSDLMQKTTPTPAQTLFVGVKDVVRRESTSSGVLSGRLVQKANAYIQRNAHRGISVEDVAHHLGCSRRLADLRFRELMGVSIGETIIATRLDEVKQLLATTRETIDAISVSCGYKNPTYLKNLFKKRFGMSMRDWRRQGREDSQFDVEGGQRRGIRHETTDVAEPFAKRVTSRSPARSAAASLTTEPSDAVVSE